MDDALLVVDVAAAAAVSDAAVVVADKDSGGPLVCFSLVGPSC